MIKKMQSIDSIETYTYGMRTDLICKKEETKFNNILNYTKIINYDEVTKKNINQQKLK